MGRWLAATLVVSSLALVALCCTLLVLFLPSKPNQRYTGCASRQYASDSVVCVCNSTYCDAIDELSLPIGNDIIVYTTTKDGRRFDKTEMTFQPAASGDEAIHFSMKYDEKFQTVKGFGGAFTDAAGINIRSLSEGAQENLLRSYFSGAGIEYNIARVPMASCDFSTRLYTYADDVDDFALEKFALATEDFEYKIPLMIRADKMSSKNISFFASPWSAPAWMKTNNNLTGKGSLIGKPGNEYHQAWALYFSRFIEEYEANGVHIWGVTAQNEPQAGLAPDFPFQCMGFTAEHQRDFVKTDLGPTLHVRGHGDVKVMIGDTQRITFPQWAETVLSDPDTAGYVSGIAVHWYTDFISDPVRLSRTHELFPDHFILGTEACAGAMPWDTEKIQLGNWVRGQRYSMDILQDLNNWAVGWVDWNLALDMRGGPNWVKNFVDAPIIVNADADEFYKQPTFYHLGHFSKFIPEGSVRIGVEGPGQSGDLKYAGFVHPQELSGSFVLLNTADSSININIQVSKEKNLAVQVPRNSIQTFLWSL